MRLRVLLVLVLLVSSSLFSQSLTPDETLKSSPNYGSVLSNLRDTLLQLKQLSKEQGQQITKLQHDNSELQDLSMTQAADLQRQAQRIATLSNSLTLVSDSWRTFRESSIQAIEDEQRRRRRWQLSTALGVPASLVLGIVIAGVMF